MRQRIEFTIELLVSQMNHWMLFPLAMVIMCISKDFTLSGVKPDFLTWAITGIFPILFYVLRIYVHHFLPFFLSHLAVTALFIVIPASDISIRVLVLFCAFGYLVYSFVLRLKNNDSDIMPFHPGVAVGFGFTGLLLLHYQGVKTWDNYCFYVLIITFILYFIIYYLKHYLTFLSVNESSAGFIPARDIFHSGLTLLILYTLFGAGIMILAANISQFEKLISALKDALFSLLRAFFSLFKEETGQQEYIGNNSGYKPPFADMELLPEEETSTWFWQLLEYVLIVLLVFGLFFVAVRVLISIIRFVRERFLNKMLFSREKDSEECQDIREKCEPEQKEKSTMKNSLHYFSPRTKIRKIYKKKIISSLIRPGTLSCTQLAPLTARESIHSLQLDDIAVKYELARYSEKEITNEDVKYMKQLCFGSSNKTAKRKDDIK